MQRTGARTIHRDLAMLRKEFGAPVFFDRERNGFRLSDKDWEFPKPEAPATVKAVLDAASAGPKLKLVRIACEPSAAEKIEADPLSPGQKVTRLPDGGALVDVPNVSPDSVSGWILLQKGLAAVVHPAKLAETIAEIAARIAEMHRQGNGVSRGKENCGKKSRESQRRSE
jgi:hypothetical protein